MTAIVFLEHALDLTTRHDRAQRRARRVDDLSARQRRPHAEDLLHLLLIGSDNAAARALARISPFGTEGFIAKMNEKAEELGLEHTHYADPSGLHAQCLVGLRHGAADRVRGR